MDGMVYSVIGMSKEQYFIYYNGEFFHSRFSHQDCALQILEQYGNSYSECYGFNYDRPDYLDEGYSANVMDRLIGTIGTNFLILTAYNDDISKYLVCDTNGNIGRYLGVLEVYATKHGYRLGGFTSDSTFILY